MSAPAGQPGPDAMGAAGPAGVPTPVGGVPTVGTNTPEVETRRGTELALLAFAALLVTGAIILVEASQEQKLTRQVLYYGAAYLALFGGAHLAVRRWAAYADPLILPFAALINGLGLVMIYRLDLGYAEKAVRLGKDIPASLVPKQILWTLIGLALFVLILWRIQDHRLLARYTYICGFVGLFALALPGLLPSSISAAGGAKIWLKFGIFSIQPGEFAKILLLIFFAGFLVSKRDLFMAAGRRVLGLDMPRARDLGPVIAAWGLSIGVLVLEKDLGTSLLFFGVVLVMLYIATERVAWLVLGISLFVGGCLIAYNIFSHVQLRVQNWLNPEADPTGGGFQTLQGLFSLAAGGFPGSGLGAGRPQDVPAAHTDFIATSIGEELGVVGLAAILLMYLLLCTRGMRSGLAVRDSFGKLLAAGLSFVIGFQVFVVVGGVTNLIPLTGLTAPFLSYGGSSLLANYAAVALLLRVSDAARRPAPAKAPVKVPVGPIAEAGTQFVERPK